MACYSGPEIVDSGLVLALDAANLKGFDDDENLITHSSMSGWTVGVLGSGGALPTGWVLDQQQPGSTIQIIGGGVEDGLNYVDIRFFATSVTTSNRTLIRPGNSVTTDGSTYYLTSYSKLVSGSSTNLTHITFQGGNLSLTSALVRNSGTSSVFTGTLFPRYDVGYNGTGVAYDITIRFAAPQLEKGLSASPYYATTGTAKNRGTTLIDMTGRGNNGTLTNGPTYSSSNGGSIVFDGIDDYATVPDVTEVTDFSNTNNYTVDFWVYVNSTQNDTRNADNNIVEKWSQVGSYPYTFRYVRSSQIIRAAVYNGTSDNSTSVTVSPNNWVHICGVFNWSSSLLTLYMNGGSVTSSTTLNLTGTITNDSALNLMRRGNGFNYVTGRLSNLKIYNRALTAAEIQQNYNAIKSRYDL